MTAFYTCSCKNLCWKCDKTRQVRPDATCTVCHQRLTRFFGQLTIPQSFGARDLPENQLVPLPVYKYRCIGKTVHYWRTTRRLLQPKQTCCPQKTVFTATCDKPLEEISADILTKVTWNPLPDVLKTIATPQTIQTEPQKPVVETKLIIGPRTMEAESQRDLTAILKNASGIWFLCRDGLFRQQPSPPTKNLGQDEFVDEPGFVQRHPVRLQVLPPLLVGRNEVSAYNGSAFVVSPFVKGGVTYPDFVCKQGETVYAVELKTPPLTTMAQYLEKGFYTGTSPFRDSRTIEDEIVQRATLLPSGYLQMFAFDLANIGQLEKFGDTIAALQKEVVEGKHATFWKQIKAFLFIHPDRSVTAMSQDSLREYGTNQKTLGLASTKLVVNNNNANNANNNNNNNSNST